MPAAYSTRQRPTTNDGATSLDVYPMRMARVNITIPDELDVIAETVRDFHSKCDIVFTSGGVGPTHDDITIAGVACALGRRMGPA